MNVYEQTRITFCEVDAFYVTIQSGQVATTDESDGEITRRDVTQ